MSFALDTNLFRNPTPRRFLHGIAVETGETIIVLPEVKKELLKEDGHLASAEYDRYERRVAQPLEKERVIDCLLAAVREWYAHLIMHANHIEEYPSSRPANEAVSKILRSFPPELFKQDVTSYEQDGDPKIVAQAIHFNVELLGSNNLRTISHRKLNMWLQKTKGWNNDLISTPSETINRLAQEDTQTVYRWIMAHAMNRVSNDVRDNRKEYKKALNILQAAGFREEEVQEGEQEKNAQPNDVFQTIVFEVNNFFQKDRHFQEVLRETLLESKEHIEHVLEFEFALNKTVNEAILSLEHSPPSRR